MVVLDGLAGHGPGELHSALAFESFRVLLYILIEASMILITAEIPPMASRPNIKIEIVLRN